MKRRAYRRLQNMAHSSGTTVVHTPEASPHAHLRVLFAGFSLHFRPLIDPLLKFRVVLRNCAAVSMKALVHDALMRKEIILQLAVGQKDRRNLVASGTISSPSLRVRRSPSKLNVAAREAQYSGRFPTPVQEWE